MGLSVSKWSRRRGGWRYRHTRSLRRNRRAGIDPLPKRGHELLVRRRDRRAARARLPAPEHQRVVRDVLEERGEVLAARRLRVLERRRELGAREADEDHLRVARGE